METGLDSGWKVPSSCCSVQGGFVVLNYVMTKPSNRFLLTCLLMVARKTHPINALPEVIRIGKHADV